MHLGASSVFTAVHIGQRAGFLGWSPGTDDAHDQVASKHHSPGEVLSDPSAPDEPGRKDLVIVDSEGQIAGNLNTDKLVHAGSFLA